MFWFTIILVLQKRAPFCRLQEKCTSDKKNVKSETREQASIASIQLSVLVIRRESYLKLTQQFLKLFYIAKRF